MHGCDALFRNFALPLCRAGPFLFISFRDQVHLCSSYRCSRFPLVQTLWRSGHAAVCQERAHFSHGSIPHTANAGSLWFEFDIVPARDTLKGATTLRRFIGGFVEMLAAKQRPN